MKHCRMCEELLRPFDKATDGLCAICHINLCQEKKHCARCKEIEKKIDKWLDEYKNE